MYFYVKNMVNRVWSYSFKFIYVWSCITHNVTGNKCLIFPEVSLLMSGNITIKQKTKKKVEVGISKYNESQRDIYYIYFNFKV